MEKQEAARQKQLAEAKARQARQVAAAATRPELKKWIDDDMIERNARSSMYYSCCLHKCQQNERAVYKYLPAVSWHGSVRCSPKALGVGNGRERQAAEAADEARRKAEVAAKKAALQAALQSQLQEHAASKQQASAAQREELASINQSIQVARNTRPDVRRLGSPLEPSAYANTKPAHMHS